MCCGECVAMQHFGGYHWVTAADMLLCCPQHDMTWPTAHTLHASLLPSDPDVLVIAVQELSNECRLITRSAFLHTQPVQGFPDVWVLIPATNNTPSLFNNAYTRRLAAQQALPLSKWDPEDPASAARKAPVAPTPFKEGPRAAAGAAGGPHGGLTPASLIPALGGAAAGGGPGGARSGAGPRGGGGAGPGAGGYGGQGGAAAGGGGDSNKGVKAAVADVLRSKVANVPAAFGE